MADVVAFGEVMLRFSPQASRRLEQSQSLDVFVGGSELNTIIAAQRLGLSTSYVTCLPKNVLGKMVVNQCREQGVDTSHILWREDSRLGLYFFEYGAAPRSADVLYDRRDSAFSRLRPGDIDWAPIMQGSKVFLTSGISPAVAPGMPEVVTEALKAAKSAGLEVAYDINFRRKLWNAEAAARTIQPMMEYTDILFTTEEDAREVLGVTGSDPEAVAREISSRYGIRCVNYIYPAPPESGHLWEVVAVDGCEAVFARRRHKIQAVDRLGAGDAYSGGFLYGYLRRDLVTAVEFGNALLALKNTVLGDFAWVSLEEVEALASGQGGAIRR